MRDFNEIKENLKDINIRGANLDEVTNVNLDLLTKYFDAGENEYLLKKLEEFYIELLNNNTNITPMKIKDGKVIIEKGLIYHSLPPKPQIETLRSISQLGVVATEWFGILESEQEGCFCVFLDEIREGEQKGRKHLIPETNPDILRSSLTQCVMYFDKDNPVVDSLLSFDFFEYQKVKRDNPEKVPELYPEWIVSLYEKIILPCSPASYTFHDSEEGKQYTWHAIPAGIPPQFINGLCINSLSPLNEYLEEIKILFPNATIFNEDKEVIHDPQIQLEQDVCSKGKLETLIEQDIERRRLLEEARRLEAEYKKQLEKKNKETIETIETTNENIGGDIDEQ